MEISFEDNNLSHAQMQSMVQNLYWFCYFIVSGQLMMSTVWISAIKYRLDWTWRIYRYYIFHDANNLKVFKFSFIPIVIRVEEKNKN